MEYKQVFFEIEAFLIPEYTHKLYYRFYIETDKLTRQCLPVLVAEQRVTFVEFNNTVGGPEGRVNSTSSASTASPAYNETLTSESATSKEGPWKHVKFISADTSCHHAVHKMYMEEYKQFTMPEISHFPLVCSLECSRDKKCIGFRFTSSGSCSLLGETNKFRDSVYPAENCYLKV